MSWLDKMARRLAAAGPAGKLASRPALVHGAGMRRLAPAAALLLASCATAPERPAPPAPTAPQPVETGDLIGLDASDLGSQFGAPDFQVREGDGTKLQWRGQHCVLDSFLYPSERGGGLARVVHVETRNRNGQPVDQASCLAEIRER